jgi:hypothetical protein
LGSWRSTAELLPLTDIESTRWDQQQAAPEPTKV